MKKLLLLLLALLFSLSGPAIGANSDFGCFCLAAKGTVFAGESTIFKSFPGREGVQIPGRLSPAQMEALTVEHCIEFSQIYKTGAGKNGGGGTYWLYSGSVNSVAVPIGQDVRWINHTHPGGTPWASGADKNVLRLLQEAGSPQKSSQIIPIGGNGPVRFGN